MSLTFNHQYHPLWSHLFSTLAAQHRLAITDLLYHKLQRAQSNSISLPTIEIFYLLPRDLRRRVLQLWRGSNFYIFNQIRIWQQKYKTAGDDFDLSTAKVDRIQAFFYSAWQYPIDHFWLQTHRYWSCAALANRQRIHAGR